MGGVGTESRAGGLDESFPMIVMIPFPDTRVDATRRC